MTYEQGRVYPAERASGLDNRIRHWLHNPYKILQPYITEGMTVLDIGCGPGFFTLSMARLVGASGRVIAVDLQQGMLDKLQAKIVGTELEGRITLHRCTADRIGVAVPVDFALCFWLLHELPNQAAFIAELNTILKPGRRVLVVEPCFIVPRRAFAATVELAVAAGFVTEPEPRVFFSQSVVVKKSP